ncbi:MAG: DUF4132 domain-containing protein [Coriobacteriia bacterium]|nr:DUF4132 domain-containing protein [Coriobacteriia bacterium]
MPDSEKTERNLKLIKQLEKNVVKLIRKPAYPLLKAIWDYFCYRNGIAASNNYNRGAELQTQINEAFLALCGYPLNTCGTLDDFFHPELTKGLEKVFGKEEAGLIRSLCSLAMEFPYSKTLFRPSYRSSQAGIYTKTFLTIIEGAFDFACYGISLEQTMLSGLASQPSLDYRIAYALRQGDPPVSALVEQAIIGDNSRIVLDFALISAVVKSGEPRFIELLGKLLLASQRQEGVRQAILEACDTGTLTSHIYFIRLILENGLTRFSSVIRAFDTWTGLAFGNEKPAVVDKSLALALRYLESPDEVATGLESADVTESYMALWAQCCVDVNAATDNACRLLDSPQRYQRLLAWYFITHTNSAAFRHSLAVQRLATRDLEELAWVCANLHINYVRNQPYSGDNYDEAAILAKSYRDSIYPDDAAGREALFGNLAEVVAFVGRKERSFEGSVFPWFTQTLDASLACDVMLALAAYDRDPALIARMSDYLDYARSDTRLGYYSRLLDPHHPEQRQLMLDGLTDRSSNVRERIVERLASYELSESDLDRMMAPLASRSAGLRKALVTLLEQQPEALIRPVIDQLLASRNRNQLIAGVELLEVFSRRSLTFQADYAAIVATLGSNTGLPQDISILLDKIGSNIKEPEATPDNGFGLYDPAADFLDTEAFRARRPQPALYADDELSRLLLPDKQEAVATFGRIASLIHENRDYEYETEFWDGSRKSLLLGDQQYGILTLAGSGKATKPGILRWRGKFTNPITDYPLAEVWQEAAGQYADDLQRLAALLICWNDRGADRHKTSRNWFAKAYRSYPLGQEAQAFKRLFEQATAGYNVSDQKAAQLLEAIYVSAEPQHFDFAFAVYLSLLQRLPEQRWSIEYEQDSKINPIDARYRQGNLTLLDNPYINDWRKLARHNIRTDEQFTAYFNEMWFEHLVSGKQRFYGLDEIDIFRAIELGIAPPGLLHYYFTGAIGAVGHMQAVTWSQSNMSGLFAKYPAAQAVFADVVERVVSLEEQRGELPAALSIVASRIKQFDGGIQHFSQLLAALGDTGFYRGYDYIGYMNKDDGLTKKQSLSRLLRYCQPLPDDSPEALHDALAQAKVSEKRIIQAAVYAPQWARLLEQAAGIEGLKCGVWFFHAHVNESFSAEKETEVAFYSVISAQEFVDGAFDKDWFIEAYSELGEQRFQELYKNAKYITNSSSSHRRSQLYADAVLGRLDKDATKAEIIDKRNQEKIRAYALIPLSGAGDATGDMGAAARAEALERYEFIQSFRQQSKQFGALRQASEGKACDIALNNLAITAGFSDVDRMTWALEGAKLEQLRPLMEPKTLGECEVWLQIDADGAAALMVRKNGKMLKSPPKDIAKDSYLLELKDAQKQLRVQRRRARSSLEAAMVARSVFNADEVAGLLKNPVLGATVRSLVFMAGEQMGFPGLVDTTTDGTAGATASGDSSTTDDPTCSLTQAGSQAATGSLQLFGINGTIYQVGSDESLTIAHPHDLLTRRCWSDYQQLVFRQQLVQPFKQVFREYYAVTADELEAVNLSRRYAGYQVQPMQAKALFKSRGWTVDYESGLQRVWHRKNLIVRLFALADWFSPADIEAPTLEAVRFYSRDKDEPVAFQDIDAVLFSETMRDIDLAVSVAYVGGVDPEASQSTVEMRVSIARELMALLGVENVSFKTAHALVKGQLGEYSVHMGSGVVHKSGTGMIAVLPVHSQARGRIFLPFADDDPKTAEVMSKILLFSEDSKIKDPSILEQIRR